MPRLQTKINDGKRSAIDLNDPLLQQKLNESFKKMKEIASEDPIYFFNTFLY